jgi:hypothetical protein
MLSSLALRAKDSGEAGVVPGLSPFWGGSGYVIRGLRPVPVFQPGGFPPTRC